MQYYMDTLKVDNVVDITNKEFEYLTWVAEKTGEGGGGGNSSGGSGGGKSDSQSPSKQKRSVLEKNLVMENNRAFGLDTGSDREAERVRKKLNEHAKFKAQQIHQSLVD